jgi:hypothetical protein
VTRVEADAFTIKTNTPGAKGRGNQLRLTFAEGGLVRWKALPLIRRGGFPKGAPAPREIRPVSTSADPERAARRLADQAEAFLDRIASASRERRVRLTHAYFGKLSAHDVLTLLTSHAHHHRRQISGPAQAGCDIVRPTRKGDRRA